MPEKFTSLIVDKTARADTLSRLHERSPHVDRIVVAPGSDYIAEGREKEVIVDQDCDIADPQSVLALAVRHRASLVEISNDTPIALGAGDVLREHGFPTIAPTAQAAMIESDKHWARELMAAYEMPSPRFEYCRSQGAALAYLAERWREEPGRRFWLKAIHLQEGKGAIPCHGLQEAAEGLRRIFDELGENDVLVEDDMPGEEFSYYGLSDGEHLQYLKPAQDNKRLREGDRGPNTGGMGAVAPARVVDGLDEEIRRRQMESAIRGLAGEGRPFTGVLYLGGMRLDSGSVSTVEYNARPGDPEAQVVWEGIQSDYVELLHAMLDGRLHEAELVEDDLVRACLVLASPGYPEAPETGLEITGLRRAAEVPGVSLRSYAIRLEDGVPYTDGGRVLSVTGAGAGLPEALESATEAAECIGFEGGEPQFRRDIGWRDLERLENDQDQL